MIFPLSYIKYTWLNVVMISWDDACGFCKQIRLLMWKLANTKWVNEWGNELMAWLSLEHLSEKELNIGLLVGTPQHFHGGAGKLSVDSSFTGHFCPCLWAYHNAMHRQSIKTTVISRTHNWTLILGDTVERMICQPDRAWVLTSADWLRTQTLVPRIRPQAQLQKDRDDTVIDQEPPLSV